MKAALCVLVMGLAVLSVSAQTDESDDPTTVVVDTSSAVAATTPPPPDSCGAEVSAECPEVDPDVPVFLPDPTDCGKFCECSNGVAISLVCPPGTLYDEDIGGCATADDVDCGDRPDDEDDD